MDSLDLRPDLLETADTAPSQDVQVRMLVDSYKVIVANYEVLPAAVKAAFDQLITVIQMQSIELENVSKARADISRIRSETATRLSEALKEVEEWKAKAEKDALTGLMNKGALEEAGQRLFEKSRVSKKPLTEMVLDLDYFKGINDIYGHQAGDEVLKQIAKIMKDVLRPTDHVFRDGDATAEDVALARDGGEEFVVILPVGLEGAQKAAERLRKRIESTTFSFSRIDDPNGPKENVKITASIGLCEASYDQHVAHSDVKRTADAATFTAKNDGRNCVYVFQNGIFAMTSPQDRYRPEKRGNR